MCEKKGRPNGSTILHSVKCPKKERAQRLNYI
jgi:hypothetical protein